MKIIITIPDEKYHYIKELERGNTDYATTLMLYHAVKYGKPFTRPQGEWINHRTIMHDGEYYCSNCDEAAEWLDGGSQFLSKFCPNCGAEMRGGGKLR